MTKKAKAPKAEGSNEVVVKQMNRPEHHTITVMLPVELELFYTRPGDNCMWIPGFHEAFMTVGPATRSDGTQEASPVEEITTGVPHRNQYFLWGQAPYPYRESSTGRHWVGTIDVHPVLQGVLNNLEAYQRQMADHLDALDAVAREGDDT